MHTYKNWKMSTSFLIFLMKMKIVGIEPKKTIILIAVSIVHRHDRLVR